MSSPKISVIMSVRNGMPYLPEAVHSILEQTFTDFEFIILDNASTDGSVEWIAELKDSRIRLLQNEKDIGLSASLNRGLDASRGQYVARMDADDISLPNRFQAQLTFMDEHSDISVCGGQIDILGSKTPNFPYPYEHRAMCSELFFEVPMAHPAVMFRRQVLQEHGLRYDEKLATTQDYEMWCQIAGIVGLRMANLKEVILHYRKHEANASSVDSRTLEEALGIRVNYFKQVFPDLPEDDAVLFGNIVSRRFEEKYVFLLRSAKLLQQFLRIAEEEQTLDQQTLRRCSGLIWHDYCVFLLKFRSALFFRAICNPLFFLLPVTSANHICHRMLRKIKKE